MASIRIIGSLLSELPEKLNYHGVEVDFFSEKRARLFPAGKTSKKTKETDLTSIFLSTLASIKPYREAMLSALNPKTQKVNNQTAQLYVFTEISNRACDGSKTEQGRPDGLMVLTTGKAKTIEWAAFVEVKVNSNLNPEQIKRYIDVAKSHEVDLITISDQIVSTPFQTPIKEKLSIHRVNLYHWSWIYIRTKAQQVIESSIQIGDESKFDVDQIYILREFVRYLDDPRINVGHFENMGRGWSSAVKEIRQAINGVKLSSEAVNSIANAWLHEEQDLCYHIYLKTKLAAYLCMTRKESVNAEERLNKISASLIKDRSIFCSLTIPQSTSVQDYFKNSARKKIDINVHFMSSSVQVCVDVDAKKNQKAVGQTSDLINKMERVGSGMEDELKICGVYKYNKNTKLVTLKELQEQKARKIIYSTVNKDFGDQIERFKISQHVEFGRDSFASPVKFIVQFETAVTNFITQVYNI